MDAFAPRPRFAMRRTAKKGDLDSSGHNSLTPLHLAALRGRYEVAKVLIDSGCDLNPKDRDGLTPLYWAASVGEKDVVKLLLERGAQVNCVGGGKFTLLHLASSKDWSDIVLCILEQGGEDPNAADAKGKTPLMLAAREGNRDVASHLIRAGADVHRRDEQRGTALHEAAYNGHTAVVQVLLEVEGLDLNPQDEDGGTPLHEACQRGHQDAVRQLLVAGADPDVKNNASRTALSMHLRQLDVMPEVIRLLLQYGAFFEEFDFERLSQNPVLRENVLKDANLCTRSIVNKFHRHSLPALYRNPYLARKLPTIDNFKLKTGQIVELENLVRWEIERNTLCEVLKVRPMALSALCVLSLAALPIQA